MVKLKAHGQEPLANGRFSQLANELIIGDLLPHEPMIEHLGNDATVIFGCDVPFLAENCGYRSCYDMPLEKSAHDLSCNHS